MNNDDFYSFRVQLHPETKAQMDRVAQQLCGQLGIPVQLSTAFRIMLHAEAQRLGVS